VLSGNDHLLAFTLASRVALVTKPRVSTEYHIGFRCVANSFHFFPTPFLAMLEK
jgi:hypothetical protein